jgi:uncharacterized protein
MRRLLLTCLLLLPAACGTDEPSETPSPSQLTTVTFPAADGGTLTGRVYGAGSTAVVLSNMGDNDRGPWDGFAPVIAARGYTVLTYRYREPLRTSVADLQAAIAYVKSKGAARLALVGASMGGMATAKVAGAAGAAAVVLMACPLEIDEYDFRVTEPELAALTGPKLVVASEDDDVVPLADTRAVYDRSPEPKDFATFPSTAHGVRLFATPHREALQSRLVNFLTTNAPP